MATTMSLKERISSPLEAGISILDAHHLPPQVIPALEYTSNRLAKKSMHITLVVARRDYQLPAIVPPKGSPGLPTPTTPGTPGSASNKFGFPVGPVSALKQMVRSATYNGPVPHRLDTKRANGVGMNGGMPTPSDLSSPRFRWPLTPLTPMSPPPMTPCTSTTTDTSRFMLSSPNSFGMRLIHANGLHPKAEKALKSSLEKAEKKFHLGAEWLSPAVSPAKCGLTNELIHTSILQNDVLFSSEGLTLLTLDRLYSLKSALSSYSKTRSHLRLEDAVDELRRTILSNNAKVYKADILRSYDWLSVSTWALNDLDRMYRRAYGGPDQIGGISGMPRYVDPVIIVDDSDSDYDDEDSDTDDTDDTIGLAVTSEEKSLPPTPPPKTPILKLQTTFAPKPPPKYALVDDEGERTARPADLNVPQTAQKWNNSTIDQILNSDIWSAIESSPKTGPMTPKGYDDISPTTRGEWGFLMVDNALQNGRTVAVETC